MNFDHTKHASTSRMFGILGRSTFITVSVSSGQEKLELSGCHKHMNTKKALKLGHYSYWRPYQLKYQLKRDLPAIHKMKKLYINLLHLLASLPV